jgi:hypothetical protein
MYTMLFAVSLFASALAIHLMKFLRPLPVRAVHTRRVE